MFEKSELIIVINVLQKMINVHIKKGIESNNIVMSSYYKGKEDDCREIKQFFEDQLMEKENRQIN